MALAARSMVETDSCNLPQLLQYPISILDLTRLCAGVIARNPAQDSSHCLLLPVEVARPAVAVSMTPSRLRLKSMQISLGSFFFLDKR